MINQVNRNYKIIKKNNYKKMLNNKNNIKLYIKNFNNMIMTIYKKIIK